MFSNPQVEAFYSDRGAMTYQQLLLYAEDLSALLTQNKQLEKHNQALSVKKTDHVTGLPTRALLLRHAGKILAAARHSGTPLLLVVLNIHGLRKINNAFGRETGDSVLQHVADHLKALLEADDLLVRLEGDEFAILTRQYEG